MLSVIRAASASRTTVRAFSTSTRRENFARLTLVGNLGKAPELKTTKNAKEYVSYSVATTNFLPNTEEGDRAFSTTWHRILCFSASGNKYLQTLKPGTKVYVEAAYEIREPEAEADPSSPQGQRQIFLRHENIRVISQPRARGGEGEGEGESEEHMH